VALVSPIKARRTADELLLGTVLLSTAACSCLQRCSTAAVVRSPPFEAQTTAVDGQGNAEFALYNPLAQLATDHSYGGRVQ
jgi:hypothetical protein